MNQTYWLRQVPFVRMVIPLLMGVIFQYSFDFEIAFLLLYVFIFVAFGMFSYHFRWVEEQFAFRWIFGLSFFISLFFIGIFLTKQHTVQLMSINEEEQSFVGVVSELPEEKQNSVKVFVELQFVNDTYGWKPLETKALLYFEKETLSKQLAYGDLLIFKAKLSEIQNSKNPNEFDYKQYLANKGVAYQAYVTHEKWNRIGQGQGDYLRLSAQKVRAYFLQIYRQNGLTDDEFAVAAALTLGYKHDLDAETRQSYAATGAMHILAVSGLHVGIIFMIIKYFLFFLDKVKWGKYLKFAITIFILWAFAYISGLSPSVRRAAIMFSFISASMLVERKVNIYNSIAASAFFLILENPFIIFQVGFQLSYLAVLSIIFFQPKIHALLYIKNKMLDKLWALVSVSIAAQIGTSPIALFYFHQFPNYFIITNLIVIPMAILIVYSALALLILSFSDIAAYFVGKLLVGLTYVLNQSIALIEKMPYSTTQHIDFNSLQLFGFYAVVGSIILYLIKKQKRFLQIALLLAVFLFLGRVSKTIETQEQQKMVIFNVNKSLVINFIQGNKGIIFTSDTTINSTSLQFAAQNFWTAKQIVVENYLSIKEEYESEHLKKKGQVFIFSDKKMVIIDDEKSIRYEEVSSKMPIDLVIISKSPSIEIEDILSIYQPKQIVFDPTVPFWQRKLFAKECESLGISYFSIKEEGAFTLNQ